MRATAIGFYDIERLCAAVVGAVEDGTDGQTEGKPEFVTRGPSTCCRRNQDEKKMEDGGVRRTALGHFVGGWSRVCGVGRYQSNVASELYSLSAFANGGYLARHVLCLFWPSSYSFSTVIRCTARMHTLSLVRYRGELIKSD